MDTAGRLRAGKDSVVLKWATRATARLPEAAREHPLALVDALPDFLDQLVEVLASPAPRAALAHLEGVLAIEHGRERAQRPNWSLGEVVAEYQILREVTLETLEASQPITREERDLLLDGIAAAVRNAVNEFERLRNAEREERVSFEQERFAHFVESVRDYAIFTVSPDGYITS